RLITENAQQIGGSNLAERLPVVGQDEFAGLAKTLNGMLGRLEDAFRLEQATTQQLRETVEQQRRFTADASHELKTPLATIKAHTGLLKMGELPEEDAESVGAIDTAANRMTGLVNDLLILARADGGSLVAKTANVDLMEAVNEAVCAVSPGGVDVRPAPRPLVVEGNAEAITRLFINLLDNAKKYAGTDERVEVRFAKRGDTVEIAVVDHGVGIAPEHLSRLFNRFYRPDTSRTSETGGTGLGLAICREIATAHGGTIEVASTVGKGTTFTVVLPLAST
ncbi:HAMP domain-containing histidine kinase, partial [bacterium]